MADGHVGNPVKAVFDPNTGITSNYIATRPDIPVPDKKHDYLHGHYDVQQDGSLGPIVRDPGQPRP